jgi:hypothetical protein
VARYATARGVALRGQTRQLTRVIASLGGRLWRAEGSRIELGRVVGSDAIQGPQAESGVAAVNRPAGDARSGQPGKQQNKEKQDDHRTNTLLTLLAARVGANQQATAAGDVDDGNDVPAVIQRYCGGDVVTTIAATVVAASPLGRSEIRSAACHGWPVSAARSPGMGPAIAAI